LLFLSPGAGLWAPTVEGLVVLAKTSFRTAIVVASERPRPANTPAAVTWLAPPANAPLPPFAVRYGDGPIYALIRDEKGTGDATRMFHTQDCSVVEYLTFRLQREFGLSELF
jgi:hypothetical protein